jgi:ParB-like chromosome segregation protein Spo0J
MNHPIDSIQWVDVDLLQANDYNPNHVMKQELDLLKTSILSQGWIQPILVTKELIIIDGFHRHMLAKTDSFVRDLTKGKVPVAMLDLTELERKALTVRINRAKGVHSAVKMHELVSDMYGGGMSVKDIMLQIGATKQEVELLLREGVFKNLDIESHEYGKSWIVKDNR